MFIYCSPGKNKVLFRPASAVRTHRMQCARYNLILYFFFYSRHRTLIRPMSGPFPDPTTVVVTRNRGSSVTQRRLSRDERPVFASGRNFSQKFATVSSRVVRVVTAAGRRGTPVVWINGCLSSKTSPRNLVVGCRSTVSNFHRYVFDVPACPRPGIPNEIQRNS